MTEAAPVASALRVALLARPGPAADRLRATLAEIGTELVLEADPVQADPQALADAAPQAVVVVLDPAVEDVLDQYDAVLADPAVDVLYEEADLAIAREGWDAARWGRHLSAKLMHHGDVLPPGREADAVGDVPDLQPGRPPTPAQLAEGRPDDFDQAEAARMASQVPLSGNPMFDPVAAEYGDGGDGTPVAAFDAADGFEARDRGEGESPPAGTIAATGDSTDGGANDARSGPDGGPRYQRDLADLDRRIAEMSLVDDSGMEAATAAATGEQSPAPGSGSGDGPVPGAVMVFAGIGGPDAVRQFLGELPDGFPRPVLVQQRLDGGRHDRLVQQMARVTALPVQLAEAGSTAAPGHVYILPTELGVVADGDRLRFAAAGADDSIAALPAEGSAVLVFSGADPAIVDAAMRQSGRGTWVAGQSPEGCYDAEGPGAVQARGAEAGQPADLARRLAARWKA